MEGTLGEVRMFGGNFAPRNWQLCDGQLLPIAQNNSLFSILGTIYGGDGRTTFALPDCRSRLVLGEGNGAGLSNYQIGQRGGTENVTLSISEIPSHDHTVSDPKVACAAVDGDTSNPEGHNFALAPPEVLLYTDASPSSTMASDNVSIAVNNTGGNQSHMNVMPSLVVNYIICIAGIFPSRS